MLLSTASSCAIEGEWHPPTHSRLNPTEYNAVHVEIPRDYTYAEEYAYSNPKYWLYRRQTPLQGVEDWNQ
jgi:hypothetical protein